MLKMDLGSEKLTGFILKGLDVHPILEKNWMKDLEDTPDLKVVLEKR